MSVEIHEAAPDDNIEVTLSGKFTKHDYQNFVPRMETAIQQHGKVWLLVKLRDFHGWTTGALCEDIKFDWKHFADVERLAIVGERKWEAGMAVFCRPFTRATIKYFDIAKVDKARKWITADARAAVAK